MTVYSDEEEYYGKPKVNIPGPPKPIRPKPWVELDRDGKLERMREMVKSLQRSMDRILYTEIAGLRRSFLEHEHTANGNIVVPVKYAVDGEFNSGGIKAESDDPKKVYF